MKFSHSLSGPGEMLVPGESMGQRGKHQVNVATGSCAGREAAWSYALK